MTTQSQIPSAVTPIIIQLPSQLYQQEQLTPGISNNTNTQLLASPNVLPSVGEFLNNLDQKYNSNIHTSFEGAFLNEEITVNYTWPGKSMPKNIIRNSKFIIRN